MDNYKANCINAVADGSTIICPQCNASNAANSKFCATCGTMLETKTESSNAPAFATVADDVPNSGSAPAFAAVEETPVSANVSAFASVDETPATTDSASAFKSADAPAQKVETVNEESSESAFANGLPAWSIEPPQVMVRRR